VLLRETPKREFHNFAFCDNDRPHPRQSTAPRSPPVRALASLLGPLLGSELTTCLDARFSFDQLWQPSPPASSASGAVSDLIPANVATGWAQRSCVRCFHSLRCALISHKPILMCLWHVPPALFGGFPFTQVNDASSSVGISAAYENA
jgi:hypothetical protein